MRRISYIMPVDYITGSLCTRQSLSYSTSNGTAWDSETESVSPTQYQPIIVAARKKKTGVRYYWVKGATTTRLTPANRLSLAAFGAASSKYYALMNDSGAKTTLETIYNAVKRKVTFRNFIFLELRQMYANKETQRTISDGTNTVTIYNDFTYSGTVQIPIPSDVKSKFTNYLT